jgi:hypothetical protein
MTPLRILKQAVTIFEKRGYKYCLIGGHAASLYRSQERLTRDVDFAIAAEPLSRSRKLAAQAIEALGLKPVMGFIPASPGEAARRAICMVTSSPAKNEKKGIIDILLPELPWVLQAIERARHNRIDLGFALVPVITPEDLILAKCYALRNSPDRFQDLDDLKEILENVKDLDLDYLRFNLTKLGLSIPKPVQKFAPPGLSE